ncbi:MAG: hypothetical protein K2H01_01655 [Ruminococcus sp.]|nr:hypothetical protein [Ruminococcus sp.]
MNKISCSQLTTTLLLSSAFMLMCFSAPIGTEYMAGTAISFVIQAILCIPIIILYRKGFSLSAYCSEKHFLIPCIFVLYFILHGGMSFVLVFNGAEQLSLPFSAPLVTAVLIGIVCFYTASLGLCAFARASSIVFGILVITLAVLLTGAWQRIDTMELAQKSESSIIQSTLQNLSLADTLPAVFVLMNFTDGKKPQKALFFLPLGLILWELVLFLCITVLGSLLPDAQYPFFLLTSVSQPLSSQRADSLYLILFVLLCILRITLLTVLSAHFLGMVFKKLRFRSIITLFLMIGSAVLLGSVNYSGSILCIIAIVLLSFVVPLTFCLRLKNHVSWKEKNNV